jgi:hypothetical protein
MAKTRKIDLLEETLNMLPGRPSGVDGTGEGQVTESDNSRVSQYREGEGKNVYSR